MMSREWMATELLQPVLIDRAYLALWAAWASSQPIATGSPQVLSRLWGG